MQDCPAEQWRRRPANRGPAGREEKREASLMNTIHIVHGSLQRTRKLPPRQCVTLTDDLTDGILHRDRYQNQRLRTAHSGSVVRDLELVREAAAELRSFDELIIWAGPAHQDQLMLAWLVPWLRALQVPGSEGYLGILAHHAPLITALKAGRLDVRDATGRVTSYDVTGGFLEVSNNRASVLADSAEPRSV